MPPGPFSLEVFWECPTGKTPGSTQYSLGGFLSYVDWECLRSGWKVSQWGERLSLVPWPQISGRISADGWSRSHINICLACLLTPYFWVLFMFYFEISGVSKSLYQKTSLCVFYFKTLLKSPYRVVVIFMFISLQPSHQRHLWVMTVSLSALVPHLSVNFEASAAEEQLTVSNV